MQTLKMVILFKYEFIAIFHNNGEKYKINAKKQEFVYATPTVLVKIDFLFLLFWHFSKKQF